MGTFSPRICLAHPFRGESESALRVLIGPLRGEKMSASSSRAISSERSGADCCSAVKRGLRKGGPAAICRARHTTDHRDEREPPTTSQKPKIEDKRLGCMLDRKTFPTYVTWGGVGRRPDLSPGSRSPGARRPTVMGQPLVGKQHGRYVMCVERAEKKAGYLVCYHIAHVSVPSPTSCLRPVPDVCAVCRLGLPHGTRPDSSARGRAQPPGALGGEVSRQSRTNPIARYPYATGVASRVALV